MKRAQWLGWGALLCAGCLRPDAGTEFRGNADIQVAILCKSHSIGTSDDGYWMTVTVRHKPDVQVAWDQAQMKLERATLVRRESGREERTADGWVRRMETFYVRGVPSANTASESHVHANIGPWMLGYRRPGEAWSQLESDVCEPGLHE
jgi:hypothetical protein